MKQKNSFIESEGDAWLARNAAALRSLELPGSDPVIVELLGLSPGLRAGAKVLEIGCGDGTRLSWLKENAGFLCSGVDPSRNAVETASARGIDAHLGTADSLPFDDESFDVVVFGFCLYVCDREDLFRIAEEADRVLKNGGWLVILDFFSPSPLKREYHHRSGLFSYKMDYRTLFTWHPAYVCLTHKVRDHSGGGHSSDPNVWVATSVMTKNVDRHD